MPKEYLVWDEMNGSRELAARISADYASDAAERYAADDVDGMAEGLYCRVNGREIHNLQREGHPVTVEETVYVDGRPVTARRTFLVGVVEFEPVWGSVQRVED